MEFLQNLTVPIAVALLGGGVIGGGLLGAFVKRYWDTSDKTKKESADVQNKQIEIDQEIYRTTVAENSELRTSNRLLIDELAELKIRDGISSFRFTSIEGDNKKLSERVICLEKDELGYKEKLMDMQRRLDHSHEENVKIMKQMIDTNAENQKSMHAQLNSLIGRLTKLVSTLTEKFNPE